MHRGVVPCSVNVQREQNEAIIEENAVRILPHLMAYNVKNDFVRELG